MFTRYQSKIKKTTNMFLKQLHIIKPNSVDSQIYRGFAFSQEEKGTFNQNDFINISDSTKKRPDGY